MSLKLSKSVFGTQVAISVSGERGKITAFSLYQRTGNNKQFFVEYCAADGRAAGDWFFEDQLTVVAD